MDGHRHDSELRRPQHHDGLHRLADRRSRELPKKFRVSRMAKPALVQHGFGDRIGHDGCGTAGKHVGDAAQIAPIAAGALLASGCPGRAVT